MTSRFSRWLVAGIALAALSSACANGHRLSGVVRLAEASSARCYIDGAGQLSCLGGGITLPDATQTPTNAGPRPITGMTGMVRVAMSRDTVCGLRNDGKVLCFGAEVSRWTLGDRATLRAGIIEVDPGAGATDIAVGDGMACAVISGGQVSCWGVSTNAAAFGRPMGAPTTGVETVSGLSSVTQVAFGSGFACARIVDGTVSCWGSNFGGALGDGTMNDAHLPVQAQGLRSVVSIVAGSRHVCAQREDRSVWCWGGNDEQQLGSPGAARSTPAASEAMAGAAEVFTSYNATCWRTADGALRHTDPTYQPGQFGAPTTARRLLSCGLISWMPCVELNSGDVVCY